jgi:hypothetical protein
MVSAIGAQGVAISPIATRFRSIKIRQDASRQTSLLSATKGTRRSIQGHAVRKISSAPSTWISTVRLVQFAGMKSIV